MNELALTTIIVVAATSAAVMAGLYFAFSAFIMKSFDDIGAENAVAAMNSINEVILRSSFMVLFFGSTLLFAALTIIGLMVGELQGSWMLVSAGALYVLGMFGCTAAFNVPLNNRLAAVGPGIQEKTETWVHYYRVWTKWNHLRAVCSLLSSVLCTVYLVIYI